METTPSPNGPQFLNINRPWSGEYTVDGPYPTRELADQCALNTRVKVVNLLDLSEQRAAERNQKLIKLCAKLLEELNVRITDRADSSLPEWEAEAKRLGVSADNDVCQWEQGSDRYWHSTCRNVIETSMRPSMLYVHCPSCGGLIREAGKPSF